MTSLGKAAICESLTCDNLSCTGTITASHKSFGNHHQNRGEMHHDGSCFYLKWSAVYQVSGMTTTSGSDDVVVTTTGTHHLVQGDTVHISDIPLHSTGNLNGIPVAELTGELVVSGVSSTTEFTIQTTTTADTTAAAGGGTAVDPQMRVDYYLSKDMLQTSAAWQHGTKKPEPLHTNTADTFYS